MLDAEPAFAKKLRRGKLLDGTGYEARHKML